MLDIRASKMLECRVMDAKDFLARYGRAEAQIVADRAGTNYRYFYQLATGKRRASVELAERLVVASGGRMDQMAILNARSKTVTPPAVAVEGDPPAVITLPTNRHETEGETHSVTDADVAEYTALYPGVDVPQALRSMRGWLLANPGKRKTLRGMPRFINTWLTREQNRGGTHGPHAQPSAAPARRLTAAQQIREKLADCD